MEDPYDELLSMILDGPISAEDGDALRLSPLELPPTTLKSDSQSRVRLEAEFHLPAVEPPTVAPANEWASSVHLEVEFHKPVTMEPLCITWEGQSKMVTKQPKESHRLTTVKGEGYPELFIQEEEEAREEEEESSRNLNERLTAQVEHAVWTETLQHACLQYKNRVIRCNLAFIVHFNYIHLDVDCVLI